MTRIPARGDAYLAVAVPSANATSNGEQFARLSYQVITVSASMISTDDGFDPDLDVS
jgi:hypothetical protein